jgi:hypothetical protein
MVLGRIVGKLFGKMAAILLINFITTPSDTRLPAYLFMYMEK